MAMMEKRDDETMAEFEARVAKATREYKKSMENHPLYKALRQGEPGHDYDFKKYDMPPSYDSLEEEADRPVEKARKRRSQIEEQERKTGKKQMLAKGGYVKAADGCAKKGKTKGRMV
jgi:hypothetical protein